MASKSFSMTDTITPVNKKIIVDVESKIDDAEQFLLNLTDGGNNTSDEKPKSKKTQVEVIENNIKKGGLYFANRTNNNPVNNTKGFAFQFTNEGSSDFL
jgi:hypothetical protein